MFDELNLAEIACEPLYPGQRLIVCRNPLVAEQRARTRRELLAGTEKQLGEELSDRGVGERVHR